MTEPCGNSHRCFLQRQLNVDIGHEQAWFECFNCHKRWGWNDWIVDEANRTVKIGDLFEFVPSEGSEFLEGPDANA